MRAANRWVNGRLRCKEVYRREFRSRWQELHSWAVIEKSNVILVFTEAETQIDGGTTAPCSGEITCLGL